MMRGIVYIHTHTRRELTHEPTITQPDEGTRALALFYWPEMNEYGALACVGEAVGVGGSGTCSPLEQSVSVICGSKYVPSVASRRRCR